MSSMEEKIVKVLREADRPMRALDIGKALGFETKREVNQVIYKLKGVVEISNPGSTPPLWRLVTSSASSAPQPPQSGASLAGQMSGISIGDETTATWSGKSKLLGTIEATADGKGFVVRALSRDEVITRGTSATSTPGPSNIQATDGGGGGGGGRDGEPLEQSVSRQPVQETGSPDDTSCTENEKKLSVNPLNLTDGVEVKKDLEKDVGDNSKQKEYASQVYAHATGGSQNQASPQPSSKAAPRKQKPKIAANFTQSPQALKKKILEILANGPLDTYHVSQQLEMPTRVEAMQLLEELKRDGLVSSIEREGVSIWSLK